MSKKKILSILIGIIPISYIFGSFSVNINILLIIIYGVILFFGGKRFKLSGIDNLVILFFGYIVFTSIYNTIEIYEFEQNGKKDFYILNKSLLFLRYLFLYLSIRLLLVNKLLDFKIIFYLFSSTAAFVIFDVILQFFAGKDLFGFSSPYTHKNTGPFFDEAIAGGFISSGVRVLSQ